MKKRQIITKVNYLLKLEIGAVDINSNYEKNVRSLKNIFEKPHYL